MSFKKFIFAIMVGVLTFAISGCGSSAPSSGRTISVAVDADGTDSYVNGSGICSGSDKYCYPHQVSSITIVAYFEGVTIISANPQPGTDAIGDFNTIVSWSGCPQVNNVGGANQCRIPGTNGSDVHATATFSKVYVHSVIPSAGANGSISPNTPQAVNSNEIASFAVTPNTGFNTASVTGCGGTLFGNIYTTGPVTTSCTVSATFAP